MPMDNLWDPEMSSGIGFPFWNKLIDIYRYRAGRLEPTWNTASFCNVAQCYSLNSRVSVAHVLYVFFRALFRSGNIFSKNALFGPLGPLFWKPLKFLNFFEKHIPGGVAHVLYAFFKALFRSENIFFKKCVFWPSGTPFLKTPKIFEFFWETFFRGCGTCFICVFSSSFQIWK